ncbi:MAG: hypothetical protein HeimC2_03790 [Candidatus Heimdallarchaeota archaeon LC_2]|nr:MAG: hypothetical protein HeimC2_03790 [Candidatus Heimdallarchaeota archaeon LC_2]
MTLEIFEIIANTCVPVTDKTSTAKGDFNPEISSTESEDPFQDGIPDDSDEDAFISFSFNESFALLYYYSIQIL